MRDAAHGLVVRKQGIVEKEIDEDLILPLTMYSNRLASQMGSIVPVMIRVGPTKVQQTYVDGAEFKNAPADKKPLAKTLMLNSISDSAMTTAPSWGGSTRCSCSDLAHAIASNALRSCSTRPGSTNVMP